MSKLTFSELRSANVKRCEESFHPVTSWSVTDWAVAVGGEVGELLNLIKKVRRFEDSEKVGINPRNLQKPEPVEIANEAADVVIYLDLLCARQGIDLGEAVRRKFNQVSDDCGSEEKL